MWKYPPAPILDDLLTLNDPLGGVLLSGYIENTLQKKPATASPAGEKQIANSRQ
jgi:hypothetical protein